MKVLIIGGSGFFGKRLTQKLIDKNWDVTLLNRGNTNDGFQEKIKRIQCDRSDTSNFIKALENESWDVVYDQICFDYKDAQNTCKALKGKTKKLIFTSSQSVYDPGEHLTEQDFNPKYHLKNMHPFQ